MSTSRSSSPASASPQAGPTHIAVRGARVHNLRDVDVDIPLGRFVAIAGVSGSGKSSLALGVLYAEGSRRYLDALSTYTRRRISQSGRAEVREVRHVPAALVLRQRPPVPDVRSTFGTSTELLNYLRLAFSRLGSHVCPNGHRTPPSRNVALEIPIECPECGISFLGPGAEEMAFNSEGACRECSGTGVARTVDVDSLVPDESKTIDEGAVVVWGSLMWSLMKDICREMGVRTDVPFRELTEEEKDIVYRGPAEKRHILYANENTGVAGEMDFTYFNAIYTVENALAKAKDEKGLKRVAKFLKEGPCPSCGGTRLNEKVRSVQLAGRSLPEVTRMTLDELEDWIATVSPSLPPDLRPMARQILAGMAEPIARLQDLGLGYLSLKRPSSTLSTGERQRVHLTRAVRNRTTGVLYVLDEPSIGLHPANVDGLLAVIRDLVADGNSVLVVDHDVRLLRAANHLLEIGPGSGADGGEVIAQGSVDEVCAAEASRIGPFLAGTQAVAPRTRIDAADVFAHGSIELETAAIHTVRPLSVRVPRGRLTAVTGVSGSGKTTLVLESLVPALRADIEDTPLPAHVTAAGAEGLRRVNLIDSTPIGANVRSTVATYSGVLDGLRRAFGSCEQATARGLKMGAFSYNTGSLRCPTCEGTGTINLDVQFLPDVEISCPDCHGSRYGEEAWKIRRPIRAETGETEWSLPELMELTVDEALAATAGLPKVASRLRTLSELGLGYLTLGEATPALSGGEAQRLKLASEMGRSQADALFVFDEPTIGLHPLDVESLIRVLQRLIDNGATVVVIEHDLDMIANADYVIDMGPGGGEAGGRIVASGSPEDIAATGASVTGRYLREHLHASASAARRRRRVAHKAPDA